MNKSFPPTITAALAACALAISAATLTAADPLLAHLEENTGYSADEEVDPALVESIRKEFPQAQWITMRKASLLAFHYDRSYTYTRTGKDGPYEEKDIGPRADGFLFTLRLRRNPPLEDDPGRRPQIKVRIDSSRTLPEEKLKTGAGGLFPTADAAYYYSINLTAGLEVDDKTLDRVVAIIKDFASQEIKVPVPAPLPLKDLKTVWEMVFNVDSSKILARTGRGELGLWNVSTGQPVPFDPVSLPAASPCITDSGGRYFLMAGDKCGCRIYDFITGRPVSPHIPIDLPQPPLELPVFFSPDCRSVLLREYSGACHVIRIRDGASLAEFSLSPCQSDREVRPAASFSKDGQSALLLDGNGALHRYDTRTWKSVGQAVVHPAATGYSIGFAASEYHAFAVTFDSPGENGPDGNLQLWDLSAGRPVGEPVRCKNGVSGHFFDGSNRLLVKPGRGGTRVLRIPSLETQFTLPAHDDVEASFARITTDGEKILAWGYDRALSLTNIATGKTADRVSAGAIVQQILTGQDPNSAWVVLDNMKSPVRDKHDQSVVRYDLTNLKPAASLTTNRFLQHVILSPNGKRLLIHEGSKDGERIRLFDATTLTELPATSR